jgi:hypothetical protein
MIDNLTEENFQLFAMKHYQNPHCMDLLEFHDDLKRIRYIKRLLKKYKSTNELKERLIINHLVVLYNMFEGRAMTRMLLLKLDEYHDCLKPFLILLNYWTVDVGLINNNKIVDSDIGLDKKIVEALRNI